MISLSPVDVALICAGAGIILAYWLPRLVSGREPAATPLLIAAGAGIGLAFPGFADRIDPVRNSGIWYTASAVTVAIALFGSGLRIDRLGGLRLWSPAVRMLVLAMPLTIASVALLGWQFAGLGAGAAILLGASLAPTDPVLAGDVQVGPPLEGGEHPVRFTLTSEAGLNDGLGMPFVMLALLVLGGGSFADWGGRWLLVDMGWRIVAGAGGGVATGWLLGKLLFDWPRGNPLADTDSGVVALAGAMLAYGLTEILHGYGFIAVFVAGIMLRRQEERHDFHRTLHDFSTNVEHALVSVLLVALGIALPALWPALTWPLAAIGAALVFIIRPVTGWLSLAGTSLRPRERAVVAFYGVRGIGTICYLSYGLGETMIADARAIWAAGAWVIVISAVVHGLTAGAAVERVAGKA